MVHEGEGQAFGLEAGDDLLGVHAELQDLERNAPLDGLFLLGEVDDAEAALADALQEVELAEAIAGVLAEHEAQGADAAVELDVARAAVGGADGTGVSSSSCSALNRAADPLESLHLRPTEADRGDAVGLIPFP